MIVLARPELLERRPTLGRRAAQPLSIALEPLDEDSIGALVRRPARGSGPELVPLVAARRRATRSTPARSSARCRSAASTSATRPRWPMPRRLPDTVQATVLARLDSSSPTRGESSSWGPSSGEASRPPACARSRATREYHEAAVEHLSSATSSARGRGELTFRHIIIRDVAYGTLTRRSGPACTPRPALARGPRHRSRRTSWPSWSPSTSGRRRPVRGGWRG